MLMLLKYYNNKILPSYMLIITLHEFNSHVIYISVNVYN